LYREQIAAGLNGDRDEAEKARELLRNALLVGGEIRLVPKGRALYAHFALQYQHAGRHRRRHVDHRPQRHAEHSRLPGHGHPDEPCPRGLETKSMRRLFETQPAC
jgi:hypothetical protein